MDNYVAIVEKTVCNGKHGSYAIARSSELGSVTFSLDRKVWSETDEPERGVFVILSDVRKKRAGWRAMSARYERPADESNQQPTPESKE